MIVVGLDVGTTKIAAVAVREGRTLAIARSPNDGGSDAEAIAEGALGTLRRLVRRLGARARDVSGIGISAQQHGVLLLDPQNRPSTPFFSWQDPTPADDAASRIGASGEHRAGCRLGPGYMGATLFRLGQDGTLPRRALACFIGDFVGLRLTGGRPVTDPTQAASSGVFDVSRRRWDDASRKALELPRSLYPECREATEIRGGLLRSVADRLGLPAGLPVVGAVGDCQAAYLGAGTSCGVLVNVGTGAQVAAEIDRFRYHPPFETRPLPRKGYLQVAVRPQGGLAYARVEQFFRLVLRAFAPGSGRAPLYKRMNELAAAHPPHSKALTPGGMARSALEGLADGLYQDYHRLRGTQSRTTGAGNGLRKNPLLQRIISDRFGIPLALAPSVEEAAIGAARIATEGITDPHGEA